MMTTTNTTVFKRMGRILSLVFSDYNEARAFRSSFVRLVTYIVLFIIGYRLNLVFDNVPDGRIFDGYAMAALFCGLSVLSGFMNNMICIGGCLTMIIFMVIKLVISMAIGIIALPICVAVNLIGIEFIRNTILYPNTIIILKIFVDNNQTRKVIFLS